MGRVCVVFFKFSAVKGYYLLSSDTNVLVGMNTMCVSRKSSKHGSFLEPATFVLLSRCSSRCSRIFCGVPAMIMYLNRTKITTRARHVRPNRRIRRVCPPSV